MCAQQERDALKQVALEEGATIKFAAHDWRYYTESLR